MKIYFSIIEFFSICYLHSTLSEEIFEKILEAKSLEMNMISYRRKEAKLGQTYSLGYERAMFLNSLLISEKNEN